MYQACGGAVKVIACIEDPVVNGKILAHLDEKAPVTETIRLPESRAPPQADLFGAFELFKRGWQNLVIFRSD